MGLLLFPTEYIWLKIRDQSHFKRRLLIGFMNTRSTVNINRYKSFQDAEWQYLHGVHKIDIPSRFICCNWWVFLKKKMRNAKVWSNFDDEKGSSVWYQGIYIDKAMWDGGYSRNGFVEWKSWLSLAQNKDEECIRMKHLVLNPWYTCLSAHRHMPS